MRNFRESTAVVNCPRQRHSISLHPISGGAVMSATKPNNQMAKPPSLRTRIEAFDTGNGGMDPLEVAVCGDPSEFKRKM